MYLQLKKYFSDLADQNVHIKDKVGYFSREIGEKERSFNGIASPFLAIYDYELGLDGGELNTMGRRKLTFSIIYVRLKPLRYSVWRVSVGITTKRGIFCIIPLKRI